jgi:hypothetical protein
MIDPTETVEYNCRIVDGGNNAPRFELEPADQPGVVISAGTPTGAWSQVVKTANKIRVRNHSNSVSGPDYYGLAHNVVKALIQELPGAAEVPGYIWQTFIEEPDPSTLTPEELKAKKAAAAVAAGGAKKIVGAKRKYAADPTGEEDMAVDSHSYGASSSLPPLAHSPVYSHPPLAADPYALPGGGAGGFDPYALPAPGQAAPAVHNNGNWDPYQLPGAASGNSASSHAPGWGGYNA